MIQIDNFEKIVTSLSNNDRVQALRIIEEEINKAKEQKHNNVVKRLKLLLQVISSSSGRTGGASASSGGYRSIQRHTMPRSNALYQISYPQTKTSDVVLNKDNETLLARFMNEWRHIEQLSIHGLDPVNKLLLYGPPGTGKTMLANAIANELQYPLVVVYLDELISSYLGNTGKNIREIFTIAQEQKVVIFLDEIDTIAKHRADGQDSGELKRIVTVFLQNLDMLAVNSIVIGATNHEDLLDKAIWRRFPLRLRLDMPNHDSRQRQIALFLGSYAKNVDSDFIANLTDGMNGSAIKDLVQDAIKNSVINNKKVSTEEIAKSFFMSNFESSKQPQRTHWGKEIYKAAELLYKSGCSLKEIETMSGIPYTTLRGRLV